jgi:hypothetical protein
MNSINVLDPLGETPSTRFIFRTARNFAGQEMASLAIPSSRQIELVAAY